jgi:hypothetical protein
VVEQVQAIVVNIVAYSVLGEDSLEPIQIFIVEGRYLGLEMQWYLIKPCCVPMSALRCDRIRTT